MKKKLLSAKELEERLKRDPLVRAIFADRMAFLNKVLSHPVFDWKYVAQNLKVKK